MNLRDLWPFGRKSITLGGGSADFGTAFIRGADLLNNYYSDVAGMRGPATVNSAVMACCGYHLRTIPEPKPQVKRTEGDEERVVSPHRFLDLVKRPNESAGYPWSALVGAWSLSYVMDGNGYLRIRRDGNLQVGALEFVPFGSCEPKGENGLSYYRIFNGRNYEDVPREEIIHIRFGIDPDNTLKGMSPLKSVMREVMTDSEATVYSHSILKNMGVLGFLITPGKDQELTKEQAEAIEDRILQQFTGEDRGKPASLRYEANIQTVGRSPQEMDVAGMHKTPEERISAVFGIPAIVAGLGAGLERSTFSNMKEAREYAAESYNGPIWAAMAEALTEGLSRPTSLVLKPDEYIEFNLKTVRALQEDENAKATVTATLYEKGVIKRSEGRSRHGLDSTPEDEVYSTDLKAAQAADQLALQEGRQAQDRAKLFEALDRA